jgi:hypothetical protein
LLSVLAFNLTRGFQVLTTAQSRTTSLKRRCVYAFETIHTLRYLLLHRAGLLTCPDGRAILDVGSSPAVRGFRVADQRLKAA